MLDNIRHITGATVNGPSGRVGVVKEMLFDTRTWVIRHLVIGAEDEAFGRSHLVSPRFVRQVRSKSKEIEISLTALQLAACPLVESPRAASSWPELTTGSPRGPTEVLPGAVWREAMLKPPNPDAYVRHSLELTGCVVHAEDGAAGEVDDLFFDNETWRIEFLLVDTAGRPGGDRKVLLAHKGVERMDFLNGVVHVSLTKEQVMHAPKYHDMVTDETGA